MGDTSIKSGEIVVNGNKKSGNNELPLGHTASLLDLEKDQTISHQKLIGKVALEVEKILLENDLTMGDLAEVLDLFNARAHSVFSKYKIKDIKELYGR